MQIRYKYLIEKNVIRKKKTVIFSYYNTHEDISLETRGMLYPLLLSEGRERSITC
jgi:hypothetical protein